MYLYIHTESGLVWKTDYRGKSMKKNFFLTASLIVLTVILSSSILLGATQYPFPINQNYTAGIRITTASASTMQSMYNTWKARYVVNSTPGQRVISPEQINGQTNCTVSEGQAYGMLLAVYFNDQTLFNNLWAFKDNKSAGKVSKLMPWVIGPGENIVDPNSASDADFDIAFALLMADIQWGSGGTYPYLALGTTEVQRCRSYDINSADYHVKPGDGWDDWSYPSYYFPAFFREFATVDNAAFWNNVIAKCYNNIAANRNATSGLVGEICNHDGTRRSDNPCGGGCDGRLFKYNSCRVPFRYAMDYVWYGAAVANPSGTETNLLASFFNGKSPASVMDGYWISNNTNEGPYNNAAFVGPAACALMYSASYSSQLTAYYDRTRGFNVTDSYYNGTLQLMSLLLMTGNFHNLRRLGPPLPTSTPTVPPTTQLLDDFEDYAPYFDTSNNWTGYWYTWADAKTLGATVIPAQGAHLTMTAGGAKVGSAFYLRITGTKAAAVDPNYPSVGVGTQLLQDIETRDLYVDLRPFNTALGGIMFETKGNGTTAFKIALAPRNAGTLHPDYAFYEYTFIPPTTWTHMEIAFTDFTQPTWSSNLVPLATVLAQMQKLQWQVAVNTAVLNIDFSLDDVAFYPYLWTPTPNPSPTSTLTQTRTVTFTATPPITTTQLLDDCEDTNGTNNWGGPWFTYNDTSNAGTSYIVPVPGGIFAMTAGGAAATAYSCRVTGYVTDVYENGFVGVGTGTNANSGTGIGINLTTATGIRFWIKGTNNPISVKLVPGTTVNDGNNHYSYTITAPTTWTQVTLFFSDFRQEVGWGTTVTLAAVKGNLAAFHWQTVGQPWASIDISLDQVEVFPNLGWTPTRTASPTASATFTRTATRTVTNTPLPNTATFTRTATSTFTRTATATSTSTPVPPTSTFTGTRTASPTFTRTASPTNSPTTPPTSTFTGTRTASPTFTSTNTRTATVTNTFTRTVTPTFTISNTHTVSPTLDLVNTSTPTYTVTQTSTTMPSLTATGTGTFTVTRTVTQTSTLVSSPSFTSTRTFTSTYTVNTATITITVPGTSTITPSRTPTIAVPNSPTSTATMTHTNIVVSSPTNSPTLTETAIPGAPCSFDDMEDQNAGNNYGGFWYTYFAGNGAGISPTSPDTMTPQAGGANATLYAQRFTGTVGIELPDYPSIGTGSQLTGNSGAPLFEERDISSCTGIRFWVKGDGKSYYIKVPYTSTAGASLTAYNDYKYIFTAPAAWSQVDAPFAMFAQALGWGTSAVLADVLTHAKEFQWQTNFYAAAGTTTADLWIDEIEVYGCTVCPDAPTPFPTATETDTVDPINTPTDTPTNSNTPTPSNTFTNTPTPSATNTMIPGSPCSFDDLEDENAGNNYGGFWYTYFDGNGASVAPTSPDSMTPQAGGANATLFAQRFTGTVGTEAPDYPSIGTGSQLTGTSGAPLYTELDISSCTGIRFYVKGDGKSYYIKVPYTSTAGATLTAYNDYKYIFTAPAAWSQVDAPFAMFAQALGWGTSAVLTDVLTHAKEFQWQTNFYAAAGTTTADLWIDEIELYGCAICPDVPTPFPTNTDTPTTGVTNTFTPTPTATDTATLVPNPSLSSSINAPASVTVGQQMTIVMTVNNNGNAVINGVSPSALTLMGSGASVVLLSGPVPASVASLSIGANTTFTWVYDVIAEGVVVVQGIASGNSGAVVSPLSTSAGTNLLAASTPTFTNTNTFTNTHTFTNTRTFTNTATPTDTATMVPNPSLSSSITVPSSVTQGGQLTVVMLVNNNGDTVINNIVPSVLSISGSGAMLNLVSGPLPGNIASLAIGANTAFTWVYDVISSPGVVMFQGNASGNSGAVTSPGSMSTGVTLNQIPTNTHTATATYTYTPTETATPTKGAVIEVVTATPVLIYPNPNPTPGTTPDRMIDYTVNRPISKTVFKIYTNMGRLIRKAEDNTLRSQGKCAVNVNGKYFQGLARGIYYYVIIVTDQETNTDAKSPIEKIVIQ